jgi:hypothetical protein
VTFIAVVLLRRSEDADGANPRAGLLRENLVYDISHAIEGGREVWARATGTAWLPATWRFSAVRVEGIRGRGGPRCPVRGRFWP